jgi:hypothetical protein
LYEWGEDSKALYHESSAKPKFYRQKRTSLASFGSRKQAIQRIDWRNRGAAFIAEKGFIMAAPVE